jgi:acetylornithine/succinyldiaminopimelate/putrescine aminotransferase
VHAATEQLGRLTLTSRAFHNDQLGGVLRAAERVLRPGPRAPMNTGAEAVETGIKLGARRASLLLQLTEQVSASGGR